ncbi:MAG: hypothetical protein WBE41_27020, partial [Terracidiphilus sp.]
KSALMLAPSGGERQETRRGLAAAPATSLLQNVKASQSSFICVYLTPHEISCLTMSKDGRFSKRRHPGKDDCLKHAFSQLESRKTGFLS